MTQPKESDDVPHLPIDEALTLDSIEWTRLEAKRPRQPGNNARKGGHERTFSVPLAKITAGGVNGFGFARISQAQAEAVVGKPMRSMFSPLGLVSEDLRGLEFPLFDWLGQLTGRPVFSLISRESVERDGVEHGGALAVPCYDTSLYFDELHLTDDKQAVELMTAEAMAGWRQGHRSFKIKVGRGARYMPLKAGTKRDIAVIEGIRRAVGPASNLMIDANNGYNLNLTKHVLSETAASRLLWVEEPFHEDAILYEDLQDWLRQEGMETLVADGEGSASPSIINWAKSGLVDVIQHDVRDYGFCRWLELGPTLDGAGVKTAPHNYGSFYGNYVSGHLAAAIDNYLFVEWDEAQVDGISTAHYSIADGYVLIPPRPGFGLELDEYHFAAQVRADGWIARG